MNIYNIIAIVLILLMFFAIVLLILAEKFEKFKPDKTKEPQSNSDYYSLVSPWKDSQALTWDKKDWGLTTNSTTQQDICLIYGFTGIYNDQAGFTTAYPNLKQIAAPRNRKQFPSGKTTDENKLKEISNEAVDYLPPGTIISCFPPCPPDAQTDESVGNYPQILQTLDDSLPSASIVPAEAIFVPQNPLPANYDRTFPYCLDRDLDAVIKQQTQYCIPYFQQKCVDADQISAQVLTHTCNSQTAIDQIGLRCIGNDGKILERGQTEIYASPCLTSKCPGIVTAISFGYNAGNSINYCLTVEDFSVGTPKEIPQDFVKLDTRQRLTEWIDATITLRKFDENSLKQRFRVIRYKYLTESELAAYNTGNSNTVKINGIVQGQQESGTLIVSSTNPKEAWLECNDGPFAQIIHRESNSYVIVDDFKADKYIYNTENSLQPKIILSPIFKYTRLEDSLVWMLIPPTQISKTYPGADYQRCNYIEGNYNLSAPKNSTITSSGDTVDSVLDRSLVTLASQNYSIQVDNSYFKTLNPNSKVDTIEISPDNNFVYGETKVQIGVTSIASSNTNSDTVEYSTVDYSITPGTVISLDPPLDNGVNYCRQYVCNEVAYITLSAGKLSKTISSDNSQLLYPSAIGKTFNDGGVIVKAFDAFEDTILFDIEYFIENGIPKNYDDKTPYPNLLVGYYNTTTGGVDNIQSTIPDDIEVNASGKFINGIYYYPQFLTGSNQYPPMLNDDDSPTTIKNTNVNTKILGLEESRFQEPGPCPQQMAVITGDQLQEYKTIYKSTQGNFADIFSGKRNKYKTTTLTDLRVPQFTELNYRERYDYNYHDSENGFTNITITKGKNFKPGYWNINYSLLVEDPFWDVEYYPIDKLIFGRFIPYEYFKVGVYRDGDLPGGSYTNTPMICSQPKSIIELNSPFDKNGVGLQDIYLSDGSISRSSTTAGGRPLLNGTVPFIVNFNRTQFIPYGLGKVFKTINENDSLPTF